MRLACIEGKPVFLSFFGDVKETAAASELQRERERERRMCSACVFGFGLSDHHLGGACVQGVPSARGP